jgi:hypothetical protein
MSKDASIDERNPSVSVFGDGESSSHSAFRPVAPSVIFTLRKDGSHQGDVERTTTLHRGEEMKRRETSAATPGPIYESYVAASKRIRTTQHPHSSYYYSDSDGSSLVDPVEEAMMRKWKEMLSVEEEGHDENTRGEDIRPMTPRTLSMQFGSHGHVVGGLYTRQGLPEYVAERLEKRLAREAREEHEKQMGTVVPTPTPSMKGRKETRSSTSASPRHPSSSSSTPSSLSSRGMTGSIMASTPPSSYRQKGRSGGEREKHSKKSKSRHPGMVVGKSTRKVKGTSAYERPAYVCSHHVPF